MYFSLIIVIVAKLKQIFNENLKWEQTTEVQTFREESIYSIFRIGF